MYSFSIEVYSIEETTLSFEALPGLQNSSQIYDEYDIPSRFSRFIAEDRRVDRHSRKICNGTTKIGSHATVAWITIDLNSGRRIADDRIHSGQVTGSSHIPAMRLCGRKWKNLRPINDVGATEVCHIDMVEIRLVVFGRARLV